MHRVKCNGDRPRERYLQKGSVRGDEVGEGEQDPRLHSVPSRMLASFVWGLAHQSGSTTGPFGNSLCNKESKEKTVQRHSRGQFIHEVSAPSFALPKEIPSAATGQENTAGQHYYRESLDLFEGVRGETQPFYVTNSPSRVKVLTYSSLATSNATMSRRMVIFLPFN